MQPNSPLSNPIDPIGTSQPQGRVARSSDVSPERANTDAFETVFAQLAQFASTDASRNGKLSLAVGRRLGAGNSRPGGPASLAEGVASQESSAAVQGHRAESAGQTSSRRSLSEAQRHLGNARRTEQQSNHTAQASTSRTLGDGTITTANDSGSLRVGNPASASPATSPRDSAVAESISPQAAVAGIHAQTGNGAGRGLGPAGQPNTVAAIGKATAPGGGPTTATAASAVALGGRANSTTARSTNNPAAPHSPAHTHKTVNAFRAQLAQGLGAALRQGQGEVTLKLTPKALGELRISLEVQNGSVDAKVKPATIEARGLLEQSVETLRHALEARGLKVGRIEIEQPPAPKEGATAQQQTHPGGQDGQAGTLGDEQRESPAEAGTSRSGRGGGGVHHQADQDSECEAEDRDTPLTAGGPGVVYGVADGAARIVMVDALA